MCEAQSCVDILPAPAGSPSIDRGLGTTDTGPQGERGRSWLRGRGKEVGEVGQGRSFLFGQPPPLPEGI